MKICWESNLIVANVALLTFGPAKPIYAANLSSPQSTQPATTQNVHDPTPITSSASKPSTDMSQPSNAPTHMPSTDAFAAEEASDGAELVVCLSLGFMLAVGLSMVVVLRYSDPTQVVDRIKPHCTRSYNYTEITLWHRTQF